MSRCAFSISDRPPPEPRTRPVTFARPGASSAYLHLRPTLLEPPGDEAPDLRLARAAGDEDRVDGLDRDQPLEELEKAHCASVTWLARGSLA